MLENTDRKNSKYGHFSLSPGHLLNGIKDYKKPEDIPIDKHSKTLRN